MKETDNFKLSRMYCASISQAKYEESMAILRSLYPKFEQTAKYDDAYSHQKSFTLIDKNGKKSNLVFSNDGSKCECGCELWDYEAKVRIVPENRRRDFDITLLVRKDIAETEKGKRKITYGIHPKFHELVEGSLDALLLVNFEKTGGKDE
jgi:hypothetical protein